MDSEHGQLSEGARLGRELSLRVVVFHEAVAARLGVNATEHKVLGLIGARSGVTPGQLATATGLSHAAITKITNRLVHLGHVSRERDPSDGRKVTLRPTTGHRRSTAEAMAPLAAHMSRVTERFTPEELRVIGRWVVATGEALQQATAEVTAEDAAPPAPAPESP
ncbi:MarR family winged helix-turn-helix transcriptional regulator [Streptomyces sp. JH002]|uniref:MarR family winged helix-turn-helix transcriptional regulator n=1 Tax=Streptomyces sp. JH002 TaxID=2763259 RepID=UPI003D801D20